MASNNVNGGFNPIDLAKMDWKDISLFVLSEIRDLNKNMSDISCENKEKALQLEKLAGSIEQLLVSIKDLRADMEKVKESIVSVRITMAEKIFYGGIGGGIVTGIFKIIELVADRV